MGTLTPDTYNAPVDFRVSQGPPDNIPPETVEAFTELYNAVQQIIQTFINNCGIAQQPFAFWNQLAGTPGTILSGNIGRLYVKASEAIPNGAIVNLFNNAGVLTARNANATNNTKPADGFCSTLGGIALGAVGEVTLATGLITNLIGLTTGSRYFLSTANGLIQTPAPVAAGNIEQYLGVAISPTVLFVNLGYWIQH